MIPTQMIPVDSSNLLSVGYSHDTWDLYIEFRNHGGTYRYPKIPPTLYRELMAAASPGKFFAEHIKKHWEAMKLT